MRKIPTDIIILHATIRNLIKVTTVSNIIDLISKDVEIYRYSYFRNYANFKYSINNLKEISELLYDIKDKNLIIGNCVTIALTIFLIANFNNYKSKLIIGTKKEDYKLYAHAWTIIESEIIDLSENQGKFNEIKVFSYDD